MAAAGRSLQALCRAAFSLASAASTSAASPAALTQLGLRGGGAAAAAAATGSWGALQRHAAAAAGLRQLARVSLPCRVGCMPPGWLHAASLVLDRPSWPTTLPCHPPGHPFAAALPCIGRVRPCGAGCHPRNEPAAAGAEPVPTLLRCWLLCLRAALAWARGGTTGQPFALLCSPLPPYSTPAGAGAGAAVTHGRPWRVWDGPAGGGGGANRPQPLGGPRRGHQPTGAPWGLCGGQRSGGCGVGSRSGAVHAHACAAA